MALISISKAAELFGVHQDTLRNWEKRGKINSYRTKGNHRRYDEVDIKYCKMFEFWETIGSGSANLEQWYDHFCCNDPAVSHAFNYAKQHITDTMDQLRFIVVAIAHSKVESVTVDWKRKCLNTKKSSPSKG